MLQFLSSVLPTKGNYVLHTENKKSDGGKWHKNFHAGSIQDLEAQATSQDSKAATSVFYALGSYEDNIDADTGKVWRTQEKAAWFRALAFDVDPKDSKQNVLYTDQKSMARATISACDQIGIPHPVFVSSGNGLHCYYPLTDDISKAQWVAISSMLRDALISAGMVLDVSKICDPSMVLRPVGTHNKKPAGVKQVKLLSKLEVFDPVDLVTALKKFVKPPTMRAPSGKKSSVMAAILEEAFPPADSALIETRCKHIEVASTTTVAEPWWRLLIGIAKHCVDPVTTAYRWSMNDPRFTESETDEKLAAWKVGPSTCKKFEEQDPDICAGCQYRGCITSPIQLGIPDVVAPPAAPCGAVITMPKGYVIRGDKIFRQLDNEFVFVSDYLLFPTSRYKDSDAGKTICLVEAKIPMEGWKTFELPMDTLSKLAEFQVWLLNHQLFAANEAVLKSMRAYMLTYLQELQQQTGSDMMCSSFGWTDDTCTKFVLGDKVIEADKTSKVRLSSLAAEFSEFMSPSGDREQWIQATHMFDNAGMQLHGLVFLMSMGSPLMKGSGLKSVLVNMFSKESGTGKTTTGLFASSVYGNPDRLKLTVQDTDNSVFKTMGVYGNLPVYIDEITEVERNRLGQVVYFITQGREKRRMTKDGGFQTSVEWDSITTSSSNRDMYSLLGDQVTSEGESMRLLQFAMPQTALFNSDDGSNFGYEMSLFLKQNYGLVGEEFIRAVIVAGGPAKIYSGARAKLARTHAFTFTGKERFWQAAIVIAYATGLMAKALGLIRFDVDACIEAGIASIKALRVEIDNGRMDSFDVVGLYINEFASKTVIFKKNIQQKSEGAVVVPYPYEAVARIEMQCSNTIPFVSGRMLINQAHFNSWCRERGIDRKSTLILLGAAGVVVHHDRRVSLMRGTDKPLPSVRVFEIDMSHPRFVNIMSQSDMGTPQPTHLKLVGGKDD